MRLSISQVVIYMNLLNLIKSYWLSVLVISRVVGLSGGYKKGNSMVNRDIRGKNRWIVIHKAICPQCVIQTLDLPFFLIHIRPKGVLKESRKNRYSLITGSESGGTIV